MTDFADATQRVHDNLPVVDGHNDFPWEVGTRAGSSFDSMDPSTPLPHVHTDIERLRRHDARRARRDNFARDRVTLVGLDGVGKRP